MLINYFSLKFGFSSLPTLMLCSNNATGNLCTGVGGKKKKKMMYVTTKNAGNKRGPGSV